MGRIYGPRCKKGGIPISRQESSHGDAATETGKAASRATSFLEGFGTFYGGPLSLAALGIAFSMCWCYSSQRLAFNSLDGFFQIFQYAGMTLASVALAVAFRLKSLCRDRRIFPQVLPLAIGLALTTVVSLLVVIEGPWSHSTVAMPILAFVDGCLVGWLCLVWCTFYSRLTTRQSFACVCGMLIASSCVKMFCDMLGHGSGEAAVALAILPFASIACLHAAARELDAGPDECPDKIQPVFNRSNFKTIAPFLIGIAFIVFGTAISMSLSQDVFGLPFSFRVICQVATIALAAFVLVHTYLSTEQSVNLHDLWFTAVLIIATGLALGVLAGMPLGNLSAALFTTAQMFGIAFLWFSLSDLSRKINASPWTVFGFGWGLLFALPMCLGLLLPKIANQGLDARSSSIVVLWLLIMALPLLRQHQSPDLRLFADFTPRIKGDEQVEAASDKLRQLAASKGLSNRELEVAILYAQGRNRGFISTELVISENTVRDHLKNIYRKLGIHDKQELIDLIG